jgi:hypothetical protein
MNMVGFHLSPTSLAQYIRLENCERFLRFRLVPDDLRCLEKKWDLTIQSVGWGRRPIDLIPRRTRPSVTQS